MRIIGVLGGMSAASTVLYYARLNALARERLGGLHAAELLVRSVDFAGIESLQAAGEWEAAGARLGAEAARLEAGGAELLILATNTIHKVAERMLADVSLPFLHIADATAEAIAAAGHRRPGLMATAYTMEQDFYTGRLRAAGLAPVIPGEEDRAALQRIIFDELCVDVVREESRAAFEGIARRLTAAGADSLILGCTEVGMLLGPETAPLPVFDTTEIHCRSAIEAALAPDGAGVSSAAACR